MNKPVRDIYRRQPPSTSLKGIYRDLRDRGMSRADAATAAGIAIGYAATLDSQTDGVESLAIMPTPLDDAAYVDALVALGGFPRLSERLGRLGHTVCLPLLQFGERG